MPKSPAKQIASAGTPEEVEAAFYEAMQSSDIEKLMACWADEDDIVCIHPGGPRVVGASAIRATFDAIFSQGGSINARPEFVRRLDTITSAVHSVLEKVDVITSEGPMAGYVLATNVYHKTPRGWRMVMHHASPGSMEDAQEVHQTHQVLH